MDVTAILDGLNEAQRQAVTAETGAMRVIAGAGSGKTRVLVHRIAWVIAAENASPHSILAVTFTNKAAAEMRQRIESLLQISTSGFWVGTFHRICHRLLRTHAERVGLQSNFQILDSDDQLRLIKRLMKDNNVDDNFLKPKQVTYAISAFKENGQRFSDLDPYVTNPYDKQIHQLYAMYEAHCRENSLVDFTELLLRTVELLRDDKSIREHYQHRFKHILVDEFQDTNSIQYALIQLLSNKDTDLFIVGDDDQSIYGFRGAKVDNILSMEQQFPSLKTIKLEQNYRSTGTILGAANAIIERNHDRLGKSLWTDSGEGEPIDVYQSINEYDEAYFVSERIKKYIAQGEIYNECAILYRSNAQSRVFEETFVAENLPYRIYGGLRFFDRAEVKDAIAYMRLAENSTDDMAFDRVVNLPPRGIGVKSLEIIRQAAREHKISLLEAAKHCVNNDLLAKKASGSLMLFFTLLEHLSSSKDSLSGYMKSCIYESGLFDYYQTRKIEKKEDKLENLNELIEAADHFASQFTEDSLTEIIAAFLAQAALDAGETQASEFSDAIQLMTLHAAKGLEFNHVFLVGVEEGLFPHAESANMAEQLEEERRLAYVGITRAKQKLHLCHSEKRRLYGDMSYPRPSRFISEIPSHFLNYVRGMPTVASNSRQALFSQPESTNNTPKLGQLIRHPKFGEGVVLSIEGDGDRQRIEVNFDKEGRKWLILAFAKIELL